MSTRPKAPGGPEVPLWHRVFLVVGAILFGTAIAAVPLIGLYAINARVAVALLGTPQ